MKPTSTGESSHNTQEGIIVRWLKRDNLIKLAPLGAIMLIAIFLRFYNISAEPMAMDEGLILVGAKNYVARGLFPFRNWYQPPLRYFTLYFSTATLGFNNPLAWRLVSVILSCGSVLLTYLLGRIAFKKEEVALFAALFVAVDPTHLAFTRLGIEESTAAFLILAASLVFYTYLKGNKRSLGLLVLTAILFGLAIATKWYAVFPWLYCLGWFGWSHGKDIMSNRNSGDRRVYISSLVSSLTSLFILVALPFAIYFVFYIPWFARGYTLSDWVDFEWRAYNILKGVKVEHYSDLIGTSYQPLKWLILPVSMSYNTIFGPDTTITISGLTNLLLWLALVPAFVFFGYLLYKRKQLPISIIYLGGFLLALYLPLVISGRPIFLYSATSMIPFVSLFVTAFLFKVRADTGWRWVEWYLLAAVALAFLLYPLTAAVPVPTLIYKPIYTLFTAL